MGYLVDYSLATSEKAAAVLDYPGHTSIYEQKDLWPASIRACWQDQPMAATSFLIRELSHVKLTIDANGHQEAKIYLTASHYWKDFLGMRDA
jgi:hypothetical protein